MARMHARRRGRSGSTRPILTEKPEWVPLGSEEIEEQIVRMAKDGISSSRIGLVLRDQYGVPSVRLSVGKSITDVMRENDLVPKLPEDLVSLMKKAINLNSHMTENHKDISNKRSLQLIEAKIRRLTKYYKKTGVIPADWKYSIKTAELQIQ
ncbi:MAG: 30S ribosomal protein S15 [Methanomassiliicoccales archaeon]|nr:30S ribosomal protein S15 [Methanomassiliicoccales archaeon]NYT14429.1 30S ribosomal protein S15 [Methanomassiliicoccales archaeon]